MNEITLKPMTRELCHQYFREFQLDLDLFADESKYQPYTYDPTACDAYFDRYVQLGRVHLVVMLDDEVIGELVLKGIDNEKHCCTMGISMKTDSVKNRGYGTKAEQLVLEYAFDVLGMKTVYADALLKNKRSQHVLEKAGFTQTHEDDLFRYYRCPKPSQKCK